MSETENTDKPDKPDNRIYEFGYHIVSSVPEEKLASEVSALKDALDGAGAIFISEEFPKSRRLAYPIIKTALGRRLKFDSAYFGWIKFEMNPESQRAVEKVLERSETLLRFLLVKTVRESTLAILRAPMYRAEGKPTPSVSGMKKQGAVKSPISEAEIDKKIEEMIAE